MLFDLLNDISPLTAALLTLLISVSSVVYISKCVWYLMQPGPWGIPIFGYYPFLRKEDYYDHLHELTRKYGEIYTINIVGQNYVYIGNLKALKCANLTKGDDFSGRPTTYMLVREVVEHSLSFMDGDSWKAQRKFFVQSLKETGLRSKDSLSTGAINEAILSTLEAFHKTKKEPFEAFPILAKQCDIVLRRVMLGDDITDTQAEAIKESFLKVSRPLTGTNLLLLGNISKRLFIPRIAGYGEMKDSVAQMSDFMMKIIKEHKKTFDIDQQPRDFIDLYLRERKTRQIKGDSLAEAFTDEALDANLRQAYGDGSYSIAIFILSFLCQIALYRDAQDSLYEELLRVVGTERYATLDDRLELPLMNSAFKELLRTTKFMTVFPSLEANRDTEICDVDVPKGYVTLVNFWAINHDETVYEDPYKFDITRFLPEKGKVEQPVTFGIGRRGCAGETFVMNEVFLFMTAILQDFKLLPEKDDMADEIKPVLDLDLLLNCKIRAIPRKRGRYGSISTNS